MSEKFESKTPQQEKLILQQTKNGLYDSIPLAEDVLSELNNSEEKRWAQKAADSGHGEYIDNVKKTAEFCRARGATTKEEIEKILEEAEIKRV